MHLTNKDIEDFLDTIKPDIEPNQKPKFYWKVSKVYVFRINSILGSLYDTWELDHFYKLAKEKGFIYITYDDDMTEECFKWGYMPYPEYDCNGPILDGAVPKFSLTNEPETKFVMRRESPLWLKERGYIYKGEISRKIKLDQLKKIFDE